MMLFRRAVDEDFDDIFELAQQAGVGITTLTKDKDLLHKRLELSCQSFNKTIHHPKNEYYLFVLEDGLSGQVVGTAAIEASTGHDLPFYSYKLSRITNICHPLHIRNDYEVLNLVNDHQGKSEICTLYLKPDYRKNGNGLLLSLARFLFMAHYPNRFDATVIAEMRGISDETGTSPFWESIGRHFFQMSFSDADNLTLSTNKQYISDLMPRNALYVKLLPQSSQAVIGKPHQSSLSAMKILLREGFRYNGYVDIFDAGPTIEAPLQDIRTIASSRIMTVTNISDEVSGNRYLLANTQLHFKATISQVIFNGKCGTCILSKKTSALLNVKVGDSVRIAPLQSTKPLG